MFISHSKRVCISLKYIPRWIETTIRHLIKHCNQLQFIKQTKIFVKDFCLYFSPFKPHSLIKKPISAMMNVSVLLAPEISSLLILEIGLRVPVPHHRTIENYLSVYYKAICTENEFFMLGFLHIGKMSICGLDSNGNINR